MAHWLLPSACRVWVWGTRLFTCCYLSMASRSHVQSILSLCIWPGAEWAGCLGQADAGDFDGDRKSQCRHSTGPGGSLETNSPSTTLIPGL